MMRHMPAIPESTRSSIIVRLLDHAEKNWPQLAKVRARYHGSFAYITGVLRDGEQIPLFRLRYGGSAHSFGFAIYSPARDRYGERRPAHRAAHPAQRPVPLEGIGRFSSCSCSGRSEKPTEDAHR